MLTIGDVGCRHSVVLLRVQPAPVQRRAPDCSGLPARAVWRSLPALDLLPALFLLGEPPVSCLLV